MTGKGAVRLTTGFRDKLASSGRTDTELAAQIGVPLQRYRSVIAGTEAPSVAFIAGAVVAGLATSIAEVAEVEYESSHWRRGPLPVLRPPWRDRHAVNLTAVEMSTYDGGYYLLAGPAHSCEKVGVILTVREQYRIEYRQKHPLHWRRALAQVLRAERDADV